MKMKYYQKLLKDLDKINKQIDCYNNSEEICSVYEDYLDDKQSEIMIELELFLKDNNILVI